MIALKTQHPPPALRQSQYQYAIPLPSAEPIGLLRSPHKCSVKIDRCDGLRDGPASCNCHLAGDSIRLTTSGGLLMGGLTGSECRVGVRGSVGATDDTARSFGSCLFSCSGCIAGWCS